MKNKKFNNEPNKPCITIDGKKTGYLSRSVAINSIIVLYDNESNEFYLLCHTRGKKCPDETGKWSFNCGYLDWNESLIDCAKREIWEEIGLDLDSLEKVSIEFNEIDDSITGENRIKQNITIRYLVMCDYQEVKTLLESGELNNDSFSRGGEECEVDKIRIFSLSDSINPKDWAFNHGEIFLWLKNTL